MGNSVEAQHMHDDGDILRYIGPYERGEFVFYPGRFNNDGKLYARCALYRYLQTNP